MGNGFNLCVCNWQEHSGSYSRDQNAEAQKQRGAIHCISFLHIVTTSAADHSKWQEHSGSYPKGSTCWRSGTERSSSEYTPLCSIHCLFAMKWKVQQKSHPPGFDAMCLWHNIWSWQESCSPSLQALDHSCDLWELGMITSGATFSNCNKFANCHKKLYILKLPHIIHNQSMHICE